MGADRRANYESIAKPRAPDALKDEGEVRLLKTSIKLWRPLTAVFFYWVMSCERSDLVGAFLRSKVECAPVVPDPKEGTCPRGSIARGGVCLALPPGHRDWSGSSKCADMFRVVAYGTAVGGQLSSCSTICSLVAQVFVGTMLVDSWGRKPVMLLGLMGSLLCTALFFAGCFTSSHVCIVLMFVGVALFSLMNAFPAAVMAMASDLSCSNMVERGVSYTAIVAIQHVGICTAFIAGYFILAIDLTDYTEVWGIVFICCVAIVIFCAILLRETLNPRSASEDMPVLSVAAGSRAEEAPCASVPREDALEATGDGAICSNREGRGIMQRAASESVMAFRMVWQDSFLLRGIFLVFLGSTAATGAINITGGYAISVVGLTQSVASLAGVFQPAAVICGTSSCTWLLRYVGPYFAYLFGNSLIICGCVITGLAATVHTASEVLFWVGMVSIGFGAGVAMPSSTAFNSMRIPDKNDHGKLFAAFNFAQAVGATAGSYFWTNYLFNRQVVQTGLGGQGYYISAALMGCVTVGYFLLYLFNIRPEEQLKLQEKQQP